MKNKLIVFTELSDNVIDKLFYKLLIYVSKENRQRFLKYKYDIDKKLGLYAEFFVRHQICKELNISNHEIVFSKNEYGKPYLTDYPGFQFNIAHTHNAMVIAFSKNEIGIDIEKIKVPEFKIAKRFFTCSENNYILSHKNPEYAFYEIWTKKEAYIKCLGTGLTTPLKSFDVLDQKHSPLIQSFKIKEYLISICCREASNTSPSFIILSEAEMQELFSEVNWKQE
jgi:4'-phosphopantetheinyl transferase